MEMSITAIILCSLGSVTLGYLISAFVCGATRGSETQDLINEIAELRQVNDELSQQNDRNIKRVLEATKENRLLKNLIEKGIRA